MKYSCVDVNASDRVYAAFLRHNFEIARTHNLCLGLGDSVYRHSVDTITSKYYPEASATLEMYDVVFDGERGNPKYWKTIVTIDGKSISQSFKFNLEKIIKTALKTI